jgi:hypothetical protein
MGLLSVLALALSGVFLAVAVVLFVRMRAWRPTHPFTTAVAVESLGAVIFGLGRLPREAFGGVEHADMVDQALRAAESVVIQTQFNLLTHGSGHGADMDWTEPVPEEFRPGGGA